METPEQKRRGPFGWLAVQSRRFWIAVTIALPALYLVSAGVAQSLYSRGLIPDWLLPVVRAFYWPIIFAHMHAPDSVREAMDWYFRLWEL